MREARQRLLQFINAPSDRVARSSGDYRNVFWFAANASNNVNGTIHRPKMDAGEVFAYHAQGEKLCA